MKSLKEEGRTAQTFLTEASVMTYVNLHDTVIHNQKRHGLDASCGFYRPDAICQQFVSSLLTSSSCIKSVNIRLAAT